MGCEICGGGMVERAVGSFCSLSPFTHKHLDNPVYKAYTPPMINEQLLSGDDMDLKVREGVLGGITLVLAGKESGVSVLLSERQGKDLLTKLSKRYAREAVNA